MRFHIPSIPHTVTSKEHSACAFTQNIVNFCAMMSRRGHEIIHYGHRNSKVECAELVSVIEPETYDTLYGNVYDIRKNQYTVLDDDSEMYKLISGNTIYEISKRKRPGDFLLLFGGFWHKRIADAHSDMIVVEPAIGYPASFCKYKVYPSYAFMHRFVDDSNKQMNYYHVVIPHYFDVNDFDATQPKEDYFLFVGRLNFDKGITVAIQLTAKIGARLKVCGQGNLSYLGYDKIPDHVDFVGYVGIEERKQLMAKAKCLLMPTLYMEPFGCVAIEAMLSGTPILTNDWGGPGENNVHGVTGFKCRTFEQFEWAARNIHNINPKNCREWAEKNFSFDKVGLMYEEYFQSLQGIEWYKPNPSRTNLDHLTKHYPNAVARKIPYNLFQTFKTKDVSPALQVFMDSWKEKNPAYAYRFYDDDMCDTFMKEFDVRTWKAYRRIIPGAFKADLWRYCVLYKYGGVYVDVDTMCLGKIDDFLNDTTEFVTPVDLCDATGKLLYNAFIAAAPGSKILRDCIDTIVHNVENNIVPEDTIYFSACGVLADCTNDFLGRDKQSTFVGHHGWYDKIHLLRFEHVNQYVKDENEQILFQNKDKHNDLYQLYTSECAKLNLTPWFYCKDILKPDPLTVYHWNNKVRLGINSDGGYVIADGLCPYDLYISAGVSCEESFTRDFINKYQMNETNSFAFDGTIDRYPWEYTSNISFIRKNISTVNDAHTTNLDNLLSRHTDAFLKMDIEAHEWKWLMHTPYLKNIKQMVIEFHGVWDANWAGNTNDLPPGFTDECFEKLHETHAIVHVHGNTKVGTVNGLPNVLELTYIRRDDHVLEENTQSFPVEGLDFPNAPCEEQFNMSAQPFLCWTLSLHTKERKVYSQFGQDGIIQEIFKNVGTTNKFCVEFGQNRPDFEESNTGFLRLDQKWDGLLMDLDAKHPSIKNEMVTSKNIVGLFHKYNVPLEPDFVSIDIDSCDLWVFKSIIQSEFKPRVLSVEYNPTYTDMSTVPDDPDFRWQGDCVYGASLYALEYTGRMNGYTLVAAVYPVDCFFVRNDVLGNVPVCPLEFYSSKVNPSFNKEAPAERKAIMTQLKL